MGKIKLSARLVGGLAAFVITAGSGLVGPAAIAAPAAPPAAATALQDPLTTVEVDDPTLDGVPTIELTGELQVAVIEREHPSSGVSVEPADEELSYAVLTDNDMLVQVTGDLPSDAASGTEFTGEVAVPADVVADVSLETRHALAGATRVALPDSGEAAQETAEAASDLGTALPIAEAQLTTAPAVASDALSHDYYVAVVTPTGTTPTSYSDVAVEQVVTRSTEFWSTASRGQIPAFTEGADTLRFSSAHPCGVSPWTRWDEALDRFGFANSAEFFEVAGRHLIVALPASCESSAGVGVGTVGRSIHASGLVQVTLGIGVDASNVAHELGHNMSLGHSNAKVCPSSSCSELEYGDVYDVMGVALKGQNNLNALNARTQLALGFLRTQNTASLSLASSEATKTQTFTLRALDSTVPASGIMAIRLTDPATGAPLTVEYRAGTGQDAGAFYTRNGSTINFAGNTLAVGTGVRVHTGTSQNGSSVITWLPGSTGPFAQASNVGGTAFATSSNSLKIVATSADATAANIRVTLTDPTAQPTGAETAQPAPSPTAQPAPAPAAGQPVYRFWSESKRSHFYTISPRERDHVLATYRPSDWRYESVAYKAFPSRVAGTVPLYRFWSDSYQGHFYTASEGEKNAVIRDYPDSVWRFEGVAYYVYPSSYTGPAASVYRFWSATYRHHFFTSSVAERNAVINDYPDNVWQHEGARFKVPVG